MLVSLSYREVRVKQVLLLLYFYILRLFSLSPLNIVDFFDRVHSALIETEENNTYRQWNSYIKKTNLPKISFNLPSLPGTLDSFLQNIGGSTLLLAHARIEAQLSFSES